MKRTFIKMLPLVAAVLLATSCSKDSNDDNNVVIDPVETQNVASPDNDGVTIVPLTITVNKDGNSLSKASVDVTTDEGGKNTYTQKFIAGDVLVISNSAVLNSAATFTLKSTDEGKSTATFEGELSVKPGATLTNGTTTLNAVLKNTGTDDNKKNSGDPVAGVQEVSSLAEGFEKYGYLTADNFTYNGDKTSIQLVQNTAFVKVDLPFHGAKVTFKIGENETVKYLNGDEIFAIPNGTYIESTLLGIDKTINVLADGHKVVYNIKRTMPDGCIKGVFSVADNKQVFFSKGNLQYNVNDSKFLLADNQWDYVGGMWNGKYYGTLSGNDNSNAQGPLVDLFGWGMWLDEITTKESILKNTQNSSDYTPAVSDGQFADNKTTIEGTAWFTMSNAEWEYLFDTRENHSLYGKGTVNGVSGLIVLPDKWIQPDGVSSLVTGGTSTKYSSNNYSDQAWEKMEDNGALFLPAARRRYGSGFDAEYNLAHYWTSSASSENSNRAGLLYFIDNGNTNKFEFTYWERYRGQSVRLARGLK